MAEACVLSRSLVSALTRACSPEPIAKAVHTATIAVITIARLLNARRGLFGTGAFRTGSVATSRFLGSIGVMVRTFHSRLASMKHSKDGWDEHEGCYGGAEQASDDRASQRCV